jgi:hypothetical protein
MNARALRRLVACAALLCATTARANGRFPNAQHLWPSPRDGSLVLRATWGFALLGPQPTPKWACEDALGYGGEFDPAFVVDDRGGVWLGIYDGLTRIAPDRCAITRVPALQGANVVDLDASPDGRRLILVENTPFTSSMQSVTARVWRSNDGGDTWTRTAATLADILVDTVEMARSDPRRVYVTGRESRRPGVRVLRSDDGGDTFEELAPPWSAEAEGAFVAGIGPDRADRVYVRVVLRPDAAGGAIGATALRRSDDGGRSWREVLRTRAPMLGFALRDDGGVIWAGGLDERDGLRRSRDGGDTWETLPPMPVRCLRWTRGALYACLDAVRSPSAALARSDDEGNEFRPVLDPCDVTPGLGCATGEDPAASCAALLPSTQRLLGCPRPTRDAGASALDAAAVDATVADATVTDVTTPHDARAFADASRPSPSAGCAASPRALTHRGPLAIVLAIVSLWRRRAARVKPRPRQASAPEDELLPPAQPAAAPGASPRSPR